MPRLMSVALTEDAVVERRKTVTRRLGWEFLKPGDRLTLCRKVQGRRRRHGHGHLVIEPLVRLAEVEITNVRRERLNAITFAPEDVAREGFPDWTPEQFVGFFCQSMKTHERVMVTRIEWKYLPVETGGAP